MSRDRVPRDVIENPMPYEVLPPRASTSRVSQRSVENHDDLEDDEDEVVAGGWQRPWKKN